MKYLVLLGSITLCGLASAVSAAGTATPESQVAATVKMLMENFNKGDMKAVSAAMSAEGMTIVDEIAPHIWTGANAFDTWLKALGDFEKANGVTDDAFTAGRPTRIVISGDHAYAVQPVVYNYKQKGVATQESARMIYSLQMGKGGWLITSFTWAAGAAKPVTEAAKK